MKSLFLILLSSITFVVVAAAQSPENQDSVIVSAGDEEMPIVYKPHLNRLSANGVKLSKEETLALLSDIEGTDYSADWIKYSRQQKWGVGLVSGGAAVVTICTLGTLLYATSGAFVAIFTLGKGKADNPALDYSLAAGSIVGLAAVGTGTYFLIHSGKNKHKIVNNLNSAKSRPATLALGLQPHGVGLSINF